MAKPQQLHQTDPFEQPLDGTVGGALDERDDDQAPEGGKAVHVPSPDDRAVLEMIEQASVELDDLDSQASAINAKRKEIRERLEAKGINRWAFGYARQVIGMKESKREGMDLSYILCRKAMKDPVQLDFIDGPDGSE